MAFTLPPALLAQGYSLRPETEDDTPFLMQLFATTREPELVHVPWSAAQKQAFIAQQFAAQRRHYRGMIPNCSFAVIAHHGMPIGRLYLEPRMTQLNIVDIILLPDCCGQGLGSTILRALQSTARDSERGVCIMVEKFNPALRLYRRLGFVEIANHDAHLEMEWRPDVTQAQSAASAVS